MVAFFESPEAWLFVAIIGILVFGAAKLPEIARSIGRSRSEFKKGLQEGATEDDPAAKTDPQLPANKPDTD